MRTPQFLFYRGSTPTLELVLPLALEGSQDVAYLTFSQGGKAVLEYGWQGVPSPAAQGSLAPDPEDSRLLLVRMTQADTLKLAAGDCELQLRVRTDQGADVFPPITGRVGEVRKQGVI